MVFPVFQGSVLGPTLWNVLYDGALRVELPEGCSSIAYADDFGIEAKTESILLVGRRRIPELNLRLEEHSCRTSMHVKYLGLWLSRSGSFMRHV